MLKTIKFVRYV